MTFRNKTPLQELTSEKNRSFFHCVLIFLFALTLLGATLAGLIFGRLHYEDTGIVSPEKHAWLYWGSLSVMFLAGIFLIRQGAAQVHTFLYYSNALRIQKEYQKEPVAQSKTKTDTTNKKKGPPKRK